MIIFHWNCVRWLQCCIVRISLSLMTWGKSGDDSYPRKARCETELAQRRVFMITQGKKARVFSPHSKPHSPHTVSLFFFSFKAISFPYNSWARVLSRRCTPRVNTVICCKMLFLNGYRSRENKDEENIAMLQTNVSALCWNVCWGEKRSYRPFSSHSSLK